jgi:hypothetical protein
MSVYIQAKNMVVSPNACIYFSVSVYSLAEVDICTWGNLVSWLFAKSLAGKLPPERERVTSSTKWEITLNCVCHIENLCFLDA